MLQVHQLASLRHILFFISLFFFVCANGYSVGWLSSFFLAFMKMYFVWKGSTSFFLPLQKLVKYWRKRFVLVNLSWLLGGYFLIYACWWLDALCWLLFLWAQYLVVCVIQVCFIFCRYDYYSFSVIPYVGELVVGDRDSYQYLVESIRRFPSQVISLLSSYNYV